MRSNVFALDRDTGAQKWEAPFDIGSIGPNGVAVAYGMVYAGLSDAGDVVALNASDGSVVWRKTIANAAIDDYRNRMTVLSTRLAGGKTILHVLADSLPEGGFDAVSPDLEDVYFGQLRLQAAARAA